jgi:hypothetical protein
VTTNSLTSPVTRETNAYVRDKGLRPLIVTISGGTLLLRPKGMRNREVLDIAWCYDKALKQRVNQERAEKRAARKGVRR